MTFVEGIGFFGYVGMIVVFGIFILLSWREEKTSAI